MLAGLKTSFKRRCDDSGGERHKCRDCSKGSGRGGDGVPQESQQSHDGVRSSDGDSPPRSCSE